MATQTYEIREVNDFLKVPPKKLGKCLEEFREALLIAHMIDKAAEVSGLKPGLGLKMKVLEVFTWTDDGKKDVEITIEMVGKEEVG